MIGTQKFPCMENPEDILSVSQDDYELYLAIDLGTAFRAGVYLTQEQAITLRNHIQSFINGDLA